MNSRLLPVAHYSESPMAFDSAVLIVGAMYPGTTKSRDYTLYSEPGRTCYTSWKLEPPTTISLYANE